MAPPTKPNPSDVLLGYQQLPVETMPQLKIDYNNLSPIQQKFNVVPRGAIRKKNEVDIPAGTFTDMSSGPMSIDAVKNSFHLLTDENKALVYKYMSTAAYPTSPNTPYPEQNVISAYRDSIDGLLAFQSTTGSLIGITDYMKYTQFHDGTTQRAADYQKNGGAGGSGGAGGPTHSVSTNVSQNLSSPENARNFLDNALSVELGRKPSAKEYETFYNALTKHQKSNPSKTTIVTDSYNGSNSTKQVTTSGADNTQFSQEYAAGMEGAAEYKVATKYLDAFTRAISGGASI